MWASIDKLMFIFWLSASGEYINKYYKQHYDNIMAKIVIIIWVLYYKKYDKGLQSMVFFKVIFSSNFELIIKMK